MGKSFCRITFRTTAAFTDLTVLARELAHPPPKPSTPYRKPRIHFFSVHVPLPPDGRTSPSEIDMRTYDWWGVSREPSDVEFLTVSPRKVVVVVYVSDAPVAWAAKVCASRPGLRIKMTHANHEGGPFHLKVARVGQVDDLPDYFPDYSFEGVPVTQDTYFHPYEWIYEETSVDWESFFEVSTLQGHRFFSAEFEPRLVEWARDTGLLKVMSLDYLVYDLRALILDYLSDLAQDPRSWPWLGRIGEAALEQLRADVEWDDWAESVKTEGKIDTWIYPITRKPVSRD